MRNPFRNRQAETQAELLRTQGTLRDALARLEAVELSQETVRDQVYHWMKRADSRAARARRAGHVDLDATSLAPSVPPRPTRGADLRIWIRKYGALASAPPPALNGAETEGETDGVHEA